MTTKVIRDPWGNRHKVEIDDDLVWLAPYLTVAKRLGVPVWRIRKLIGYYVPEGRVEGQAAQIILHQNTRKFVITILKYHQVLGCDRGKGLRVIGYVGADEGYMMESSLQTLAHELAHIVEWDHTVERLIVEARLYLAFARHAKRNGYRGYRG